MRTVVVFGSQSYQRLASEIAQSLSAATGELEFRVFPDGERYQRVLTDVAGLDVVLVGGTLNDRETLEVYDLASTLAQAGAHSLSLVIPYFGYSTMERAVKKGEVVTAKTRARLLSSIPLAAAGTRVLLVDLHVDGLSHYFEGQLRSQHVYAKAAVLRLAREFGGADFVLACTDAGRAKWVESLANELGVPAAFVFKRRLDDRNTEVVGVSADVRNRKVVIYDDMIRTGGSLLKAAKAYQLAGASEVSAICTHAVFPEDAYDRLVGSGLLRHIGATDTLPRARELESRGLRVEPVAAILAEALRKEL